MLSLDLSSPTTYGQLTTAFNRSTLALALSAVRLARVHTTRDQSCHSIPTPGSPAELAGTGVRPLIVGYQALWTYEMGA
jgi:hypothetical protein